MTTEMVRLCQNLTHGPTCHQQQIPDLIILWNSENAAVEALKHFVPAYPFNAEDKIVNNFVSKYLEQLGDSNVAARRGSALAIGVLPLKFLATRWKALLDGEMEGEKERRLWWWCVGAAASVGLQW
ncbi:hypothetical protein RHMOL_Rhmol06G0041200 [Rhododendron molle]|uniref:Uncharacterized protein n=1 Tax=Rhododendron molle TaxID=49168 RepID=A0ACC0N8N0_RHOML|nr:hypothetical protein RHMOL_Rhmol06G0041200 [Rhododendron molle]